MKFTLDKAFAFSWEGLQGRAYNSKEEFPRASAAYFEVDGSHGKEKTTSDRIYYVIEGEGEFIINEEIFSVKSTDVIIVPKNTPYDYKGNLKLFLVHAPAYDEREVTPLK